MPEDLSLRQRLANPGGAPTTAVWLGIAAFACLAFLGGFVVHSGRGAEKRSGAVVRVEQLRGDVPAAAAPAPLRLSTVASLPALERKLRRSRPARNAAPPATLVAATPTPTPTPGSAPTPEPAPTAVPTPPPVAPDPAPPAPKPQPPPAPTFDSSG